MIVACSSCPAQYSVPDAKIRGKKVRITCKHCGAGVVVDATDQPLRNELRLEALEGLARSGMVEEPEDATRMMPRQGDLSVHEEPTMIGHVPAAALEAERRFSQPTAPPPAMSEAPVEPARRALSHDVPEHPLDVTDIASPQAKRASEGSSALPPASPLPTPPVKNVPAPQRVLPPQPSAELETMVSRTEPGPKSVPRSSRALYWVLGGLFVVVLLLAFMQTTH